LGGNGAGVDNRLQLTTLDVYSKGNSKLCKELNVQALPTIQFYYRGDLLTSFSCRPKELYQLEQAVDYYLEASLEGKKRSIRLQQVVSN
jgi:hypothetical protein